MFILSSRARVAPGITTLLDRPGESSELPVKSVKRPSALTLETATFFNIFACALSAWTFIRTAAKIRKGAADQFDNYILRALRRPENPAIPRGPGWLSPAAQEITALGSGANLSLASGIAAGFLCLNRRFRATGFLVASLGSGLLLSRLLKNYFVRNRPTVVPHLTYFDPESFPSGHSMGAALVYLTLGGLLSRQTRSLFDKVYFLSTASALALLVGVSRIYLGVHYPSDVLAGWAAGSLWSGACAQLAHLLQRKGTVERPVEILAGPVSDDGGDAPEFNNGLSPSPNP